MISEILAQHAWLWPAVWQSTTVLALGLGASFLLRTRAVRAHQLLLLALIAAVAVPALSHLVRAHQWGLLRTQPKAFEIDTHPVFTIENQSNPERAAAPRTTGIATTATDRPAFTHTSSIRPIAWKTLVLPLWIVLSAALLVRLAIRFALGYRLARRSAPCDVQEIADAIARAKTRLGIDSDVQIRHSADTHSPVIWCWNSRPILLVPQETNDGDNIDWQSVVCHELAHWKRRDHLSSLWAELMICALPWNPLSWLAQGRLVRLSEEACDDWVIASGQIGTRYARTLLGLTPQGRAALVPAVVSSKKGLATRVRRILTDQCASPRSGRRWSLATAVIAASLTVTIAFAQSTPAQSTGMVRTTLAHGAVIEQLASTVTIEGVVLDLDDSPVRDARIIALPMTVYGPEVDGSDEGRFELLWSPSWLEKDQHLYLIARGPGQERQAAFVEVTDLTSPVTIQLEPAFALEATVVDSQDQRIPGYRASLSLTTQFKCQAPIWATDVGVPRVGLFSPLPFGPEYKLTIEAKGYRTRHVTVDGTDRNNNVVDLGEIVLQREDVTRIDTTGNAANSELQEAFLELYHLDEGETIKVIKPPFVLGRQEWILTQPTVLDFALEIGGGYNLGFQWDGELESHSGSTGDVLELRTILHLMLHIPRRDVHLPEELNLRLPAADWVVRRAASARMRLRSLEAIIAKHAGRAIHFEKRTIERDTIVVTGEYNFTPLPEKDPDRLHIFVDEKAHLIPCEAGSLADLWNAIADGINIAIDDKSRSAVPGPIRYARDGVLYLARDEPLNKEKDLPVLLDNLARQTGLTFTVEKRPADVWFVTEKAK